LRQIALRDRADHRAVSLVGWTRSSISEFQHSMDVFQKPRAITPSARCRSLPSLPTVPAQTFQFVRHSFIQLDNVIKRLGDLSVQTAPRQRQPH